MSTKAQREIEEMNRLYFQTHVDAHYREKADDELLGSDRREQHRDLHAHYGDGKRRS